MSWPNKPKHPVDPEEGWWVRDEIGPRWGPLSTREEAQRLAAMVTKYQRKKNQIKGHYFVETYVERKQV